ncbi:carbohydrate ABC transporter permease [Haloarcula sp. AONF1]
MSLQSDTAVGGRYESALLWVEDHLRWILTLPALAVLAAFFVYPVGRALVLSLYQFDAAGRQFAGFENYVAILTAGAFWQSLWITAKFMLFAVSFEVGLGIAIAFVLNSKVRFRGLIQTIGLVPLVISPTVVALLWQLLYQNGGVLDSLVAPLTNGPVPWLSDPSIALYALVLPDVWQMTPLVTLIVLAGLQSVPDHVQEAAMMDGAGRMRRLVDVTLPYIKELVVLVLILRVIGTMRVFAKVFVLTRGGPAKSTEVISMAMYREAFSYGNYGRASTMALLLLLIALAITYAFATVSEVEF